MVPPSGGSPHAILPQNPVGWLNGIPPAYGRRVCSGHADGSDDPNGYADGSDDPNGYADGSDDSSLICISPLLSISPKSLARRDRFQNRRIDLQMRPHEPIRSERQPLPERDVGELVALPDLEVLELRRARVLDVVGKLRGT